VYQVQSPPNRATVLGQVMHDVFKSFFEEKKIHGSITLGRSMELLDERWSREGYESTDEVDLQYQRAKEILERFYEKNIDKMPLYLEYEFKLRVGKYLLKGFIDRIDDAGDGKVRIIDYKTGQMKSEKDLTSRMKKDEQLTIYAIGAKEVLGLDVEDLVLDFVDTEFEGHTTREHAQMTEIKSKIEEVADKIHAFDFPPKPNKFLCGKCQYASICPFRAE
jgi:RecB family exonuclease